MKRALTLVALAMLVLPVPIAAQSPSPEPTVPPPPTIEEAIAILLSEVEPTPPPTIELPYTWEGESSEPLTFVTSDTFFFSEDNTDILVNLTAERHEHPMCFGWAYIQYEETYWEKKKNKKGKVVSRTQKTRWTDHGDLFTGWQTPVDYDFQRYQVWDLDPTVEYRLAVRIYDDCGDWTLTLYPHEE